MQRQFRKMIKKLFKRKEKEKRQVKKKLSPESIEAMPEDIQKERGRQQGEIIALEEEIEELKKQIKSPRERQEVAKYLQQKAEEIEAKEQTGSLFLRGLFDVLSGRVKVKGIEKKIGLYSHNLGKYFGDFYDFSFNSDGTFSVWALRDDNLVELKRTPTLNKMFWNFDGLPESVRKGFFEMAFDNNGTHVDNPYKEEISQIIVDANGKYHWSQIDQRPLMAQLVDNKRIVDQLYKYIEMLERALSKVGHEVNISKLMARLNDERRKISETLLVKYAKEGNEMVRHWKEIEGEVVDKSHQLSIKNKEVDVINGVLEKMMAKIEKIQGDSNIDKAKKEILGDVDFLVGLLKGEKVSFAGAKEEIEEPLRKEYEAYVQGGSE